MKYYKAFGKGMICNGKQYAENTDYEEEGGEICGKGMMHFCETPFDTLDYYPLIDDNGDFTEFAEVVPLDKVESKDNKRASRKIHIGARLSFKEFIKAGIDVLIEKTKEKETSRYMAKIGSSGDWAQIGSSGYMAKIGSSGDWAKIGSSGYGAQIGSSGYGAKIGSSGDWAKIASSGYMAKIGSSGDWAKIWSSGDGAQIGSSGDGAQIGSSGYGAKIKMMGTRSVAAAIGYNCMASGKIGDWIVLAEWKKDDDGKWFPACVKAGQIDGKTLKEDTMYRLVDGEFKEEK